VKWLFIPNTKLNHNQYILVRVFIYSIILFIWSLSHSTLIPPIQKIIFSYQSLVVQDKLFLEILTSSILFGKCLFWVILISFISSYLSVIPIINPVVQLEAKFRAISIVGIQLFFTTIASDDYHLKIWIIGFFTTPWLITSMLDIIKNIPPEEYDHARTLRFPEWYVTWHVVIRGQFHLVMDAIIQVSLMIVVFLPVAEKIIKSDGGIGYLLTSLERFHDNTKIYAIDILLVILVSLLITILKWIRDLFCPYAEKIEGVQK